MEGTQEKNLSEKVYQHFGLDIQKMMDRGQEYDWGVLKREDAEGRTGILLGFEPEQKQRMIIDYDKDYDWVLVRRIKKDYWDAEEEGGKEEFYKAVEEIATRYAAGLIKRIKIGEMQRFAGSAMSEITEGLRALERVTATLERVERMKEAATEQKRPEE